MLFDPLILNYIKEGRMAPSILGIIIMINILIMLILYNYSNNDHKNNNIW